MKLSDSSRAPAPIASIPITDPTAAVETDDDAVWGLDGNVLSRSVYARGDVDAAFATSAHVVHDVFQTQRLGLIHFIKFSVDADAHKSLAPDFFENIAELPFCAPDDRRATRQIIRSG